MSLARPSDDTPSPASSARSHPAWPHLRQVLGRAQAEREIADAAQLGIRLLVHDRLPHAWQFLSPPVRLLYHWGSQWPPPVLSVAAVGSRRATSLGMRQSFRLGCELAGAGVAVVSGLARGIDSAALEGALSGGGRPIAVLGNGLPGIYPPENEGLARRIVEAGGAVVSEYPLRAPPRRFHFPHRNRLISAISAGVVVVEAALRSGSLITVGWGLEQGRDIFAFPGPADAPNYEGCHRLIRDGATLVTSARDVLESIAGSGPEEAPGWETRAIEAVEAGCRSPEEVMRRTGLPAALALRGWVRASELGGMS